MRRVIASGAVALAASLALPAVSAAAQVPEQSKPAAQVFSDALAAMAKVKDFHVSGRIVQANQVIALNISMSKTGGGGSFEYKGATIEIVVNPKYLYLKADAASWRILGGAGQIGTSVAQLLANKWLKVAATDGQFSSFANLTFSNKFLPAIESNQKWRQLVKDGLTTYGGRSAVVLTDLQHDGKVYISAPSPHYLLGVVDTNASSQGSLQFTDFGDAPMPATPVNAIAFPGM
jgi:hypothetical protein